MELRVRASTLVRISQALAGDTLHTLRVSMWDLAEDPVSIALLESFYNSGKPIALVCHSPGVLRHVKYNGQPLVKGKHVTGFTNGEEEEVKLTKVVPFLVEDELLRLGAIFEKVANWQPFSVVDGRLVTGQNPASSTSAAQALLKLMRPDIVPGAMFPDYELPDHTTKRRKLSELQGQHPMVLVLSRGGFCPKDRRQHEGLVQLHRELEVGYCRLVTISTDNITETNEYRSGVGANWPFLSDPGRKLQKDLDIVEYTDPLHNPMIPHVSGCVRCGLDGNRTFVFGRIAPASVASDPVRRIDFIPCRKNYVSAG